MVTSSPLQLILARPFGMVGAEHGGGDLPWALLPNSQGKGLRMFPQQTVC